MRLLIATLAMLTAVAAQSLDLMPVPAKLSRGAGALTIDQTFRYTFMGYTEPRLYDAAQRFIKHLVKNTGMPLEARATPGASSATGFLTFTIHCDHAGEPVQALGEDESYRLNVDATHAVLDAPQPLGVLRGLETFLQLVVPGEQGWIAPAVSIDDQPRFAWRGLSLDVARHFMPLDVVYRTLDGMAAVKLNTFHWHLSDDQGFRVESKRFPKLQGMGSDGHYYTQDQVRQVLAYARDRGIRVVPEFDMPGHTTSWFVGYPDLASAPGPYQIIRKWGVFDPAMDPTRESTYTFLDAFIGEMAGLFPDEYFHIGGDEVNGKQWDANPQIQAYMRAHGMKNNHELQAYFTKRVQDIVAKHGKHMEGWDEILSPALPKNIVIQSWRGQKSLAEAARMGFSGLLSAGYYLDLMHSAAQHYAVDPLADGASDLTPEQTKRILGGEAAEWVEYATPENIDNRLWPRLAVIAERLWSPASTTDVADMYRRMDIESERLEWVGLQHRLSTHTMLERLAGPEHLRALEILAAAVEPVKGYSRERSRNYTQQTPLNRLVDAVPAESRMAEQHTDREHLLLWRDNDARLRPVLNSNFLLRELIPVSANVSRVAAVGLEALDAIAAKRKPADNIVAVWRSDLDAASKPEAELLISIVAPVRKLVEQAAGL